MKRNAKLLLAVAGAGLLVVLLATQSAPVENAPTHRPAASVAVDVPTATVPQGSDPSTRPANGFAGLRSDGLRTPMNDKPMPDSITVQGASVGDSTIDRTLPHGARAVAAPLAKEDLLERFQFMDLVFTWVNGSEVNQLFKKYTAFARDEIPRRSRIHPLHVNSQGTTAAPQRKRGFSIEAFLESQRERMVNGRDRESGELRFSMRSIQEFMEWHKGRIIIVSPGHIPNWLNHDVAMISRSFNRSENTLWSDETSLPSWIRSEIDPVVSPSDPAVATHVLNRIMVVHQDSVLPWDTKITFNTNNIEPYLWKIKGLTDIYVHFNDDYLVGRATTVENFVNPYGGPILLYEKNVVRGGRLSYERFRQTKNGKTWISGVFHTNGLISELLDDTIQGSVLDVLGRFVDPRSRSVSVHPKRLFVKHSPFVYCKNMHKYVAHAAAKELAESARVNKFRNYSDVVSPFIHHAILLDAPWRASQRYIDRTVDGNTVISLNATESCPPGMAKIGGAADSRLMIMTDDLQENDRKLKELDREKPTFFALNDGFSKPQVGEVMRDFLYRYFPRPSRYEVVAGTGGKREQVAQRLVAAVVGLSPDRGVPLALTVTHPDYICPAVRSLQLALPNYGGPLHFFVSNASEVHSALLDASGGSDDGIQDHTVSEWLVPCHLKSDLVRIHYVEPGALLRGGHELRHARIYGSGYSKPSGATSTPALRFLSVDAANPAFGQTLALEDFTFGEAQGASGDSFTVATLNLALVNMINAPSASGMLRTWPLPYRRYEHLPWETNKIR